MVVRPQSTDRPSIRALICADVSSEFKRRAEWICEAVYAPPPGTACAGEDLEGIELAVVRSPFKLPIELVDKRSQLRAVIRAGSGIDGIPLQALESKGIPVHTVPLAATSVAEHAFALLLAVARDVPSMHFSTMSGEWRKASARGIELTGKTMLVIGFGQIGRAVAQLATGFGIRVLIVDPSPWKPEKQKALRETSSCTLVPLEEGLRQANFLVLCCPLTARTRHLIDLHQLTLMPAGGILVNVARAEVVQAKALMKCLCEGYLYGAGLDVHYGEPSPGLDLLSLPNVVCSPHIGAQTSDARDRIEDRVLALLKEYSR